MQLALNWQCYYDCLVEVQCFFLMQISTNGLILFDHDNQFQSYAPSSFPRTSPPFLPLVAPLWADFNFRDFGTIFYRLAADNSTLESVTDIIRSTTTGNYSEFRPTLAVVVTWFQSKLLRSEVEVCGCN